MELTNFPTEILLHILSNVRRNSDLAKVLLVSRLFRDLVEPLLYRIIRLENLCTAEELENAEMVNGRPVEVIPSFERTDRLIQTLSARPELAMKTVIVSLEVHHRLWYQHWPHYSLLTRFPRLRELSLSPPPPPRLTPDGVDALTSLRLDFDHVTDHYENVEASWLETGVPLQILSQYLWLPNLRKVQAESIYFPPGFDKHRYFYEPEERNGASLVDDLRFLRCNLRQDATVVADLVSSIKCLRRFVLAKPPMKEYDNDLKFESKIFRRVPQTPSNGPSTNLGPELIELELKPHRTTLEELVLTGGDRSVYVAWGMGYLRDWSGLKRLAVPVHTSSVSFKFKFHEVLPPQLEELQLECCSDGPLPLEPWNHFFLCVMMLATSAHEIDLGKMRELAENKEAYVPGLKRVIWWRHYRAGDKKVRRYYPAYSSKLAKASLEPAFEKVGVGFEWVHTPLFKNTPFGKRLCEW